MPEDTTAKHETLPVLEKYTTSKGRTVHLGDHFRDSRASNVRTLRVTAIHEPYDPNHPDERDIDCTVVLVDGEAPDRPRDTSTTAKRITSSVFLPIPAPDLEGAGAPHDPDGTPTSTPITYAEATTGETAS
ncbi:hypothetical protein [Nocardia asiatica]|uniref:hypothetical protein n=1 Tax=Nocardia asiatica TaxID=209252 RepID=UPI0005C222DD|nr:hypothetical protein [Nocardia asiatica]